MGKRVDSLRRLFMDGLLIAIPIALLGVLAVYVVNFFREIVRPLAEKLPIKGVGALTVLTLCAILAVILVILLLGLFVRWKGARFFRWLETNILNRIPPYNLVKMISKDVVDPDAAEIAVLVDSHGVGAWSLGLLMEELEGDLMVVFVPNAPSTNTGSVVVLPATRVRRLKTSAIATIDALTNRGLGTGELLAAASPPRTSASEDTRP